MKKIRHEKGIFDEIKNNRTIVKSSVRCFHPYNITMDKIERYIATLTPRRIIRIPNMKDYFSFRKEKLF